MAKREKLIPVYFSWRGQEFKPGEKLPEELQEQIVTSVGKELSRYYGQHPDEFDEMQEKRAKLRAEGKYPSREAIGYERMDALMDEIHRLAVECGYSEEVAEW